MIVISIERLEKYNIFSNLQGHSSKIELAAPISILKFKWAWQVSVLSHTPTTLKRYVFSIDVQMILVSLFEISIPKSAF